MDDKKYSDNDIGRIITLISIYGRCRRETIIIIIIKNS